MNNLPMIDCWFKRNARSCRIACPGGCRPSLDKLILGCPIRTPIACALHHQRSTTARPLLSRTRPRQGRAAVLLRAAASCLPLLRTVQSTPREYVVAPALYASTSSTACPRNGQWRPASHEAGGKDEASGQESLDHWSGPVNEIRDDPSGTRGEGMCLCTALI